MSQSFIGIELFLLLLSVGFFFIFRSHHILNTKLNFLFNFFLKLDFLLREVFDQQFLFVKLFVFFLFDFIQVLLMILLSYLQLIILKLILFLVLFLNFLFFLDKVSLHTHLLLHPFLHLIIDRLLQLNILRFFQLC